MPYNTVSDLDRKRIIDAYQEDFCTSYISKILKIPRTTIDSIIKTWKTTGRVERKSRGNRKSKLSGEQQEQVLGWIGDDCTITLQELTQRVTTNFNVTVSYTTIYRVMKDFHYSIKRIPEDVDLPELTESNEARDIYIELFLEYQLQFDMSQFIFIDRFEVKINMRVRQGKPKDGSKSIKKYQSLLSKSYYILVAMSSDRLFYQVDEQAILESDSNVNCTEFMTILLEKTALNSVFIINDQPFGESDDIKKLVNFNDHDVLLLPPKSPSLNPSEGLFNKWKQCVKHAACQNAKDLDQTIKTGLDHVTEEDCDLYIRNMLSFISSTIKS